MDLFSPIVVAVSMAAAKFLVKSSVTIAIGDAALVDNAISGEMAGGLMDWFKDRVKDEATRRKLGTKLEKTRTHLEAKLKQLCEEEDAKRDNDPLLPPVDKEAVGRQLCLTFEDRDSAEYFAKANFDGAKLVELLREARPLGCKTLTPADTAFYHHVLSQIVPLMISEISAQPSFHTEVAKTLLNRTDRLDAKVDAVQSLLQKQHAKVVTQAEAFEERYRRFVRDKNDHLELFGADIAREAQKLPLSVAYVTLNFESQKDGTGSGMCSAESLFDSLSPEGGRILIRGDAGMGKSTLFRWAAIESSLGIHSDRLNKKQMEFDLDEDVARAELSATESKAAFTTWLSDPDHAEQKAQIAAGIKRYNDLWWHRLPILLRLRDCGAGRLPGPDELLKVTSKELGAPPAGWIVDILERGRALILLDGVDEVRGDFRESHLLEDLENFIGLYPRNYYVVSTRPEAVPKDWLKSLNFAEARINPMGARDREELIDRWHTAMATGIKSIGENSDGFPYLAKALKTKLRENPRLSLLASNPLLCAMICALHERDDEHLPDRESRLCERLCFMLLDERDRRRGVHQAAAPDWYTKLDYEDKKLIVRNIAYHSKSLDRNPLSLARTQS